MGHPIIMELRDLAMISPFCYRYVLFLFLFLCLSHF
jgi:hypothetical protein